MAAPSHVFFPSGIQGLFSAWKSSPDAVLSAGGIEYFRTQGDLKAPLPQSIISLDKIAELRRISRTERYLEIGSMVNLSQIIHLGKIVPEVLTLCLEHSGDPQLRNQASIGGNICNPSRRLDISAPMIALDAQYEFRTSQSARWVSASRFTGPSPDGNLQRIFPAPQELLTRVRVPLEPWTFTWYRKFKSPRTNESGGEILCILRNEKYILTDIRVVYSGYTILREKTCETMLAGKRLPLDRKNINAFLDSWESYLTDLDGEQKAIPPEKAEYFSKELIKTQILNFISTTLMHISD